MKDIITKISIGLITEVILISSGILSGLIYYKSKNYISNSIVILVFVILLVLIAAIILLKIMVNVRLNMPFRFKKIFFYFKGYRFSPLTWGEIFRRYPYNKFVGGNKLPHIEVFVNNTELQMKSFIGRIDSKTEFKLILDDSIGEKILKFNQAAYEQDETLRLSDIKIDNKKRKVYLTFQKTDYRSYLISNLFTDTFVPINNQTVRDILEINSPDGGFNGSKFASHAGVSALLLSEDGKIILLRNKITNQTYPGTICGSTSGTIEYLDYKKGGICIPFEAAFREINEELHLYPSYF